MPQSHPTDLYFLPTKDHGIELLASGREIQKQKVRERERERESVCVCVCVHEAKNTLSFKHQLEQNSHRWVALNII